MRAGSSTWPRRLGPPGTDCRSPDNRFAGHMSVTVRSMAGDAYSDLQHVWLFSGCSKVEFRKIAKLHERVVVPSGTLLVEQGEAGLLFFVVLAGTASVARDGRSVSSLGPGDYFGELALLDDGPRSASVTSTTDMTLLVIRQRHFQRVLQASPAADPAAAERHGRPPARR